MLNGERGGVWRHEAEFALSGVDVRASLRSNETMTVEAKLMSIAVRLFTIIIVVVIVVVVVNDDNTSWLIVWHWPPTSATPTF
jgi:hypothetical protein